MANKMVNQTKEFSVDKQIINSQLFNDPNTYTTVTYLFRLDGSLIIGDDNGYSLQISEANFGVSGVPCQLFYDSTNGLVQQLFSIAGQTVKITYDFNKFVDRVKITIEGHLASATTVKLPVLVSHQSKNNESQYSSGSLIFDWSDIIQGQDGCTGVTWDKKDKQLVLNLEKDFLIDPSTIMTGTYLPSQPSQCNSLFYYSNKHWFFYAVGGGIYYRTSSDGTTWSAASASVATVSGNFAVAINGSTVAIVYSVNEIYDIYDNFLGYGDIYTRHGTLNSDGTVTWSNAEQVFAGTAWYSFLDSYYWYWNDTGWVQAEYGGAIAVSHVNLCFDSNNKLIITYRIIYVLESPYDDGQGSLLYYLDIGSSPVLQVVRGSATDGSLGSASTLLTYNLSAIGLPSDVDLRADGVYSIGSGNLVLIHRNKAFTYNGTSFGSAVTLSSSGQTQYNGYYFSASVLNSTVCMIFWGYDSTNNTNACLFYVEFANNAWSTWTIISYLTQHVGYPMLGMNITLSGDIYVFYIINSYQPQVIYYNKRTGSTWGSQTSFITEYYIQSTRLYVTFNVAPNIGVIYLNNSNATKFEQLVLFPTQYSGFKTKINGTTTELCLVARGNGNPNIGYKLRTQRNGTIYDIYLVETNDSNASSWHIKTPDGVKAIRKKT